MEDLHVPKDDASEYLDPETTLGTRTTAGGLKRSDRIASRRVDAYTLTVYRMLLRKEQHHKGGKEAVICELQQIIDKDVWTYLRQADFSTTQLKKATRCHMFLKEKLDAAGVFVKMKARFVAGGDGQHKTIYHNISSPTVCLQSVFAMFAIATIQRRRVVTVDITGAYVECMLPEEDEVIMIVDILLSRLIAEVDLTVCCPATRPEGPALCKVEESGMLSPLVSGLRSYRTPWSRLATSPTLTISARSTRLSMGSRSTFSYYRTGGSLQ